MVVLLKKIRGGKREEGNIRAEVKETLLWKIMREEEGDRYILGT